MSHTDIVFLSGLLWLCVGFLIGYRYHVLQVREIVARRTKRMAFEWLCWSAAAHEIANEMGIDTFGEQVVVLKNPTSMFEKSRN